VIVEHKLKVDVFNVMLLSVLMVRGNIIAGTDFTIWKIADVITSEIIITSL